MSITIGINSFSLDRSMVLDLSPSYFLFFDCAMLRTASAMSPGCAPPRLLVGPSHMRRNINEAAAVPSSRRSRRWCDNIFSFPTKICLEITVTWTLRIQGQMSRRFW